MKLLQHTVKIKQGKGYVDRDSVTETIALADLLSSTS